MYKEATYWRNQNRQRNETRQLNIAESVFDGSEYVFRELNWRNRGIKINIALITASRTD